MQNVSSSTSGSGPPPLPPLPPTAANSAAAVPAPTAAPIPMRASLLGNSLLRQATSIRAPLVRTLKCRKASPGPVARNLGTLTPPQAHRSIELLTPGRAGNNSPAAKLRSITASGKPTFKIYAPSSIELPESLKASFSRLFLQKERRNIKRDLLKEKLAEVFTLFNKSNLNWLAMKHSYGYGEGLSIMKVLNKLRNFVLSDILRRVKERFPELTIINLGTISEISDCDFSFEMPPGQEDKEAKAVSLFNEIFEKQFQSTASIVFDSNAYTQYHLEELFTANYSVNRNRKQIDMSLVMFYRNATNEENIKNWEALKEALASNSKTAAALGADVKETAATRLEGLEKGICQQLKKLLDDKILEIFARKGRQTPETQKVAGFQKNAGEISRVDPNLKVQAMNALHAEFRAKSHDTYRLRCHVVDCLRSQNVDKFCLTFEQLLKGFQEHKATRDQDEKSATAAATASQPIPKVEEQENQELEDLKRIQRHIIPANPNIIFYCLEAKRNYFEKSVNKKIADNKLQLERLQAEMKKLSVEFSDEQLKEMINSKAKVARLLTKQDQLEEELRSIEQEFAKAKKPTNQVIFEKMMIAPLKVIADSLLVQLEEANCWAGLFAQEAHVSRGAFAFTVRVIQAQSEDLLDPAEYLQAIIELLGFYLGHQLHEAPPYIKLIEGSKYIFRFSRATNDLKKVAEVTGLAVPQILETQQKLAAYFEELYALRSNKVHSNTLQSAVDNYLLTITDQKKRKALKEGLKDCKFQKNLDLIISGRALELLKKFYVPAENVGLSDPQKKALEYFIRTTHLGDSTKLIAEVFLNNVNQQLLKILAQCYHWVIKQG